MTAPQITRAAFEKWASQHGHSLGIDETDGEYLLSDTHHAWLGWNAALQAQADPKGRLTDEQITLLWISHKGEKFIDQWNFAEFARYIEAAVLSQKALQAQGTEPIRINFDVLYQFAEKINISYNHLCNAVNDALDDNDALGDKAQPAAPDTQAAGPVAWTNASWLSNPHAGHFRADRTASFNVPLYTSPPSHEAALLAAVLALSKLARLGNGDLYGNSEGNVIAQNAIAQIDRALGRAG